MKFAIVGAGAIGAFLGARLSQAGEEVYLIARGPHLRRMQAQGVCVRSPDGNFEAHPTATDDYGAIGSVDFVFLTVKAHSLTEVCGPAFAARRAGDENGVGLFRDEFATEADCEVPERFSCLACVFDMSDASLPGADFPFRDIRV